ncbi:non-canonical purine NTP pyrophosphatase [Methylobrevis pamukkalensis]|uniref:dITP/XTP pyrophosphatase n=1 Tax=Methylobrevis pamukkalensis TaxID=1439726 RepID=A0A1E3H1J3_9HYPH|nr:non-canonical purine NTP pyrophosphatase [Methylobrevis pamukkalensis]ODN69666.1 Non-canonical purine NTP pyrophosphatase [Methylobrevis pamukkalensis]
MTDTTAHRRIDGRRLLVASHNSGKIRELDFLLGGLKMELVTAGELGLPEPAETGTTFVENARIKALAAATAAGEVALSDDSGLCVEALGGAPGVYTADWAGPDRDWDRAMRLVEEELQKVGATAPGQRKAKFVSLLCLAWPDGHTQEYLGEREGELVWPPRRGGVSYGYDPVFMPDGEDKTFGQMTAEEKHGSIWAAPGPLSHRARSVQRLVEAAFPEGIRP